MRVFRWHIERLYETKSGTEEPQTQVHVAILPATDKGIDVLFLNEPPYAKELSEDDLDWWNIETDALEGKTTAKALRDAVLERNFANLSKIDIDRAFARGIVEEMVLLQFVVDNESWENLYNEIKNKKGLPDVSGLIGVNSEWLDFTRQARAMANHIYQQAMEGRRQDER